ncbi:MAG: hypothetical protein ACREL1_06185, partial [bacterium]
MSTNLDKGCARGERLSVVLSVFSFLILGVLIFGAGAAAWIPSFRGWSDIPWTTSVFWAAWETKSEALLWALAVVLGLAGWTESLRIFLFGRESLDERGPLCLGMSLAFFSLCVFGLGVNGLLSAPWVALFFFIEMPKGFRVLSNPWFPGWKKWQKSLLVFSLMPWAFAYFSPPIIWDAILDHFRFAREVARLHQIPFHWVNHTGDIPKG